MGTCGDYKKSKQKLLDTKKFVSKDENIYYLLQKNEMFLLRNDEIVGVSNYFLCLCSYINQITGKVEYLIKNPDELIVVLQKDK